MKKMCCFVILAITLCSCQKEINVYIMKETGGIIGQIVPVGIDAEVDLYQRDIIDQSDVDDDGYFYFEDLEPGHYRLIVKAPNYGTKELFRIHVTDGEIYDIGKYKLSKIPFPLLSVSPNDLSKIPRTKGLHISLRFSEQMNEESVINAFHIEPYLNDIKFSISSSSTYFYIHGKYKLGTEYTFTIDTTAKTLSGESLEFSYSSSFKTEPFKVEHFDYSSHNYGGYPICIIFNSEVNTQSLLDNLTIDPPIEVYTSEIIDDRIRLYPVYSWMSDTTITFHISSNLQEIGGAYLEEDTSFSMLIPPLNVIKVVPYHNQHFVSIYQDIDIYFNNMVDEGSISQAITIMPEINYNISTQLFSYHNTFIVIDPDSLISLTEYTVTIDTSLKDFYGRNMKQKFSFTFVTE